MKARLAKVSLALLGAAFLIAGCDNPAPLSPESVGGGPSLATAPPTGSLKLTAGDAAGGDQFGQPVSVDGRRAIVGAALDGFEGSAYVFQRTGKSWSQEAKLTASDAATFDFFGFSSSISGDVAIVGAIGDDGFTGSAYVFRRNGASWSEEAKLTVTDGAAGDQFGRTAYLDGDLAIVGAIGDDGFTGSAYVFRWNGTTWIQEQKLTASDGALDDRFGTSVSISGDWAIVGGVRDDGFTGSAYAFRWMARNGLRSRSSPQATGGSSNGSGHRCTWTATGPSWGLFSALARQTPQDRPMCSCARERSGMRRRSSPPATGRGMTSSDFPHPSAETWL